MHEPTEKDRRQVRVLSGMVGATHEEIAAVLGISEPTLRKYYREELDASPTEANAKVAQSLFRQATNPDKPNVVAAIFWMKARAGWRDSDAAEGKKEQKQRAAEKVGGRFATASPPRLAVVDGKSV
jgi:predicted transcriptional regulator